jgi:hypothetical protein
LELQVEELKDLLDVAKAEQKKHIDEEAKR